MRQKIRKGILAFSAILFPLTFMFLSPFVIVVAASMGLLNGSVFFFGILFLTSMVFSRLFCGWLCPGGAIQDNVSLANGRHWNSKIKNITKYIIWTCWFSTIVYLWITNRPLRANPLFMISVDFHLIIIYFLVTTLIFVFSLCTGKRGMCHSLCWMAPFMVIGEKLADLLHIPRLRLTADKDKCVSCGQCSRHCPMGIDVQTLVKEGPMDHTECISCFECVDCCPKKAINCGIKNRRI